MPHLIVDYSNTLDADMNMQAMLHRLHAVAIALPTIDPSSVKSRLSPRDVFLIGQVENTGQYVHVQFSLLNNRPVDVREKMRDALAAVLIASCPFGTDVAVEIREMDQDTYFKAMI